MVKRARILGMLIVVLSALFGCDYLFNGAFPASLGQETVQIDLSSEISANDATTFSLAVLKSGHYEYVLLFSNSSFDSSKNHLYVLTPGLAVQNYFTMQDILALPPVGIPLKGNTALAHLTDGKMVIGNVQASPGASGLSLDGKLEPGNNPISVELNNGAIVGPSTASVTWSNFQVDSSQNLVYQQYASDWSSSVPHSHAIGGSYWFEGAFTDPENDQVSTALLVFSQSGNNSNTQYFLTVPKDPDMVNAFPGVPLLDNPAYSSFTMNELDTSFLFVVADGIVSYSYQSRSLIHFTPQTATSPVALHLGTIKENTKMAFSFSGGYYCVWDPSTRTLTRYEDWW